MAKQDKGVLVDLTKCIGCGSCTVACKLWNKLDFKREKPALGEKVKLDDNNWTTVNRIEATTKKGEPVYRYVKQQCMHCAQPACASACFSKALQKDENGAVIYYPDLCVGCRYCMIACPFEIPKYEWEKPIPLVAKCQMCASRLDEGEAPACVDVCPTSVMKFGNRNDLLREAEQIVRGDDKYVKKIYGATEVGGTNWLYISDVPFEQLGFKMNLEETPPSEYTANYLSKVPFLAVGWGMLLTALAVYSNRRRKLEKEDEEEEM